VRRVETLVHVLVQCASKAARFCAGGLRAYMSLCRYSAATGHALGRGGIGSRVSIWRAGLPAGSGSAPPLRRYSVASGYASGMQILIHGNRRLRKGELLLWRHRAHKRLCAFKVVVRLRACGLRLLSAAALI
jgi:hypothetical protein